MCDAKNTRFFRPWNGNDHSKSEEVPSPVEKTVNSIVKCEQEDDSESVLSNDSVSNNSGQLEHDSRSSSARSYSVNSEDLSESSSLNMLRNFVFGSHPGHHSSSENSTISSEPCKVSTSEQTMFPANYYNSYAVYSPPECLPHFKSGLMPIDGLPGPFDYNHQHHHHLHYGLTGIPPPAYASVQEAVKYIHQQDVVAKQMRKLRPKKFRCEHCNVAFSNNGQLKGHIRIHTGKFQFLVNQLFSYFTIQRIFVEPTMSISLFHLYYKNNA